mgnify:CR=1 FL=1|tara:strand:- start:128 stop:1336 length:1209 start_codon:yes stop_codon:yes gene_type:complete
MVKKNLKTQMGGGKLGDWFKAGMTYKPVSTDILSKAPIEAISDATTFLTPDAMTGFKDKLKKNLNINDIDPINDDYGGQEEKIFKQSKPIWGENSFWESLQDEPCWIDPSTGSFTISGLSKLWCKWYLSDGDAAIDGLIENGPGNYKVNFEKLEKIYNNKLLREIDNDEIGDDWEGWQKMEDYKEIVAPFLGAKEPGELEVTESEKGVDVKKMVKELGLDMGSLLDTKVIQNLGGFARVFTSGIPCSRSKWIFCLITKCLLGPAGILILKILPHLIKFFVLIYNFFGKLFLGISNQLSFYTEQRVLPWKDKDGNIRKDFKPNAGDSIMSYLGLVIPWGIVSNKRGQVWGNGEFGKFIFTLMMVSVGIITMGGLGILVLLTAFFFFCGKTLMMFTNNINVKKK